MIESAVVALVASALASSGAVAATVTAIRAWLARDKTRSITITIDGNELQLSGLSQEDAERRISEFIQKHSESSKGKKGADEES